METIKLKAEKREIGTKGFLNKLRKNGRIPGVCYSKNQNLLLSVDAVTFEKILDKTAKHITIDLNIENNNKKVLVKDYAIDPILKHIIHVDFFEVNNDKQVKVKIPIILSGLAKGIKKGGVLEHTLHAVSIECFPNDIPDSIVVDITNLDVGDSVRIESLTLDSNIRVLTSKKQTLVSVMASRTTKTEDEDKEETSNNE